MGPVTLRTWMKCLTSQVCVDMYLPGPDRAHASTQINYCCSFALTFPLEKLLSKRSRAFPAQDEATSKGDSESANPSPVPGDPGTVAELRKHIEELASQNSELALKVQVRSERECECTTITHVYQIKTMDSDVIIKSSPLLLAEERFRVPDS